MSWTYRFWQLWSAVQATPDAEDWQLVKQILTPDLAQLFAKLDRSEQAHAIRVCRQLIQEGETNPLLLSAALLHDIGKTRYRLRLWERVWIVIFGWFKKEFQVPLILTDEAPQKAKWWKRPLLVGQYHPRWGASLLRQHGADERVIWLVEHHQEPFHDPSLDLENEWLNKLEHADQLC